jgi:ectoine hydroxylase-related dioxygenase (phytanoyl-CoA dioxygenase family)
MAHVLNEDGFQIIPSFLVKDEVDALRMALNSFAVAPGHRNLMQNVPSVAALATSSKVLKMLGALLGTKPFPVRSIFFDKTPEANWFVPWHQDLSIAVNKKLDRAGYGPWSIKDGVLHVQPPVEILEAMVTMRLHLDNCDDSNGAWRVISGSHQLGRLNAARIAELRLQRKEVVCSMRAGDVLLMRPLLLHASFEALAPMHRRVIHLEYATCPLAEGLEWAEVV